MSFAEALVVESGPHGLRAGKQQKPLGVMRALCSCRFCRGARNRTGTSWSQTMNTNHYATPRWAQEYHIYIFFQQFYRFIYHFTNPELFLFCALKT